MLHRNFKPGTIAGEWLIGMSDGLIVPMAFTTLLSRVSGSAHYIAVTGLMVIAAGSVIMGIGAYLSSRSESTTDDDSRNVGQREMDIQSETERAKAFFANLGLSEELQSKVAEDQLLEKKQFELILDRDEPGPPNAVKSGLIVGISYASGGLIPVVPYLLINTTDQALLYSVGLTLFCLGIVGYLKGKISGASPAFSVARLMIAGVLAATGVYLVGAIFG